MEIVASALSVYVQRLADAVVGETVIEVHAHGHGRLLRREALREKKASRGVAIEPMHRLKGRHLLLLAQDRLHRLRIVAAHQPRRLVADEVVVILPEDPDMTYGSA